MKGQITVITIIMLFVTLMVLAVLAPLYSVAINMILNETVGNTAAQLLASSLFFFVLLAVVISVFNYSKPQREYY